jgi:xylan 1,4-beta-xylosidase
VTITTGWASPPKDLKKWGDLIRAWARHLTERFGEHKVRGWPWEVWNEPDGHYWKGTVEGSWLVPRPAGIFRL